MRLFKYLRRFHPQAGEMIDVKETAVVNLLGGDAPIRDAVRLGLEQAMQVPGALLVALLAGVMTERRRNCPCDSRLAELVPIDVRFSTAAPRRASAGLSSSAAKAPANSQSVSPPTIRMKE